MRTVPASRTIEPVFRTLRSAGVQIETSHVSEAQRFVKLAASGPIAAVRVLQMVLGRDGGTGQMLTDAADSEHRPMLQAGNAKPEGGPAKLKNPHPADTLAWFAWIVARLGGWSGFTSSGHKPAGPKTVSRGLNKLDGMLEGWKLAGSAVAWGRGAFVPSSVV